MDIGVVGLGLIGGSMARTIRRNTPHMVLGLSLIHILRSQRRPCSF